MMKSPQIHRVKRVAINIEGRCSSVSGGEVAELGHPCTSRTNTVTYGGREGSSIAIC